jgi:hypothetical protein
LADEERDELLSARYRELSRLEPPARLDDAILAASRRAVHAGPASMRRISWSRRMALPVSLAAVVVLSVMVSVHVNEERPDLVSTAPSAPPAPVPVPAKEAPPAAPASAADSPAAAKPDALKADANVAPPPAVPEARKPVPPVGELQRKAAKQERQKDDFRAAEALRDAQRAEAPREQDAAKPRSFAPDPTPAPAGIGPAPAPSEQRAAIAPATAPPPPSPAAKPAAPVLGESAAGGLAASSGRLRAESRERSDVSQDAATNLAKRNEAETPEKQLERIAELRRDGRHAEADKLFSEFRQRHPAYRIPEEMLEKVRPR